MHRRTVLTAAPVLVTPRLILRGFDAHHAITADPNVHRHLGGPLSVQAKWEKFLRAPAWWALLGYGFWAITDAADGRVLGEIGYGEFRRAVDPPLPDLPELGWLLAADMHGRGLAGEALAAVLGWGDAAMPGPVQAIIAEANAPSLRLAARFGFVEVRRAAYGDGRVVVVERRT